MVGDYYCMQISQDNIDLVGGIELLEQQMQKLASLAGRRSKALAVVARRDQGTPQWLTDKQATLRFCFKFWQQLLIPLQGS